ncbi:hypothetical protein L226DRAFT_574646 [Lentinus tigrinus ALCF2SS1-7]|uniref:Uncharacterized protein n=1 Tax=Lentinus tigrinus ALCF2SS1-6 TaxID=1328759 RepID=A0A5C2RRL1_9APHY|nr:hypothetical protein L227DRAFT_616756 [Lentinus tigrinus ALCF2SS1-6]RPD70536.1 hypothetical protein L226DRAFT_574646 [Lentinus tigrinus ALCF2SS1-7]
MPTHGSGSNTGSMSFVRRLVISRLKAAKAECDKELPRVINSMTAFSEERPREGDHEQEAKPEQRELDRERDREAQAGDVVFLHEAFVLQPEEPRSALQFDQISSDGGQFTGHPNVCEVLVQRVQNMVRAWEGHPDRYGRNWYV